MAEVAKVVANVCGAAERKQQQLDEDTLLCTVCMERERCMAFEKVRAPLWRAARADALGFPVRPRGSVRRVRLRHERQFVSLLLVVGRRRTTHTCAAVSFVLRRRSNHCECIFRQTVERNKKCDSMFH